MRSTLVLRATQARQPMIRFIGKRQTPQSIDHSPKPHPAAPSQSLPDSFIAYRSRVQQHGPIGQRNSNTQSANQIPSPAPSATPTATAVSSTPSYGPIGGRSGRSLGSIRPRDGEFFDRSELPARFRRTVWSDAEIDAITSGGATTIG